MEVTDPVCGKTVDLGEAEPIEHRGWAYFFCSTACRGAFLAAREHYAASRHEQAPPRGGAGKSPRPAQ